MCIKYERMEELRSNFVLTPQMISKRVKICPYVLNCPWACCGAQVGQEVLMGPRRESVFCFPPLSVYIRNPLMGKYQKNWSEVVKKIEGIEERSSDMFYGSLAANQADALMASRLSQMPKLKTIIPRVGSVAIDALQLFMDLPLDMKPRSYQLESFLASVIRNTILYLPTGAGKTLVSLLTIAYMKRMNPQKLFFFIVDRVPLVFQQGEYLRQHLGMSVLLACGEQNNDTGERALYSYDGICCTAQLLLNFLARGIVRVEDICCLVIDEVHHARKNHPYSLVMEKHVMPVPQSYRPLVLGLTASPASGNDHGMAIELEVLCKQMGDARPYTPAIFRDDLQCHVNRPNMYSVEVESSADANRLAAMLASFSKLLSLKLSKVLQIDALMISDVDSKSAIRKLLDVAHHRKNEVAVQTGNLMLQLLSGHEMISVLGCKAAKDYLIELLRHPHKGFWSIEEEERVGEFVAELHNFSVPANDTGKAAYVLRVLKEIDVSDTSRAIIFVQTKKTARWLYSLLRNDVEILGKWNPMFFVGQGRAGTLEGMSWAEQQEPILNSFREGTVRLLISTSVLQEGLDVPSCDNIMLFDRAWSLTNFVQSRGRARSKNSRYILFCSHLESEYYRGIIRSEQLMLNLVFAKIALEVESTGRVFLAAVHLNLLMNEKWSKSRAVAMLKEEAQIVTLKFRNLPKDWKEGEMGQVILSHLHTCFELDEPVLHFSQLDALFMGTTIQLSVLSNDPSSLLHGCKKALKLPVFQDAVIQSVPSTLYRTAHDDIFNFNALGLGFGCLRRPGEMSEAGSLADQLVKVEVNFPCGRIDVTFKLEGKLYRARIEFYAIDEYLMVAMQDNLVDTTLLIPLKRPPILMVADLKNPNWTLEAALLEFDYLQWNYATAELFEPVCSHIGEMNAMRLLFVLNAQTKLLMMGALQRLGRLGLHTLIGELKVSTFEDVPLLPGGDLDKLYSLLALKSACFTSFMGRVDERVLEKLKELSPKQLDLLGLRMKCVRFGDWLQEIEVVITSKTLESADVEQTNAIVLSNTCYLKMVAFTPTRMFYQTPKPMARNRITRAFPSENFVRVQFRDDELCKLSAVRVASGIDCTMDRIRAFLETGLKIGDRTFEFLAMSSSQLREHGCWFVAPFEVDGQRYDADAIRAWMGDFSAIKNAAKYVARLGQSLSASMDGAALSTDSKFLVIPDITVLNGDKKYNFTDGIGMISQQLALDVASRLGLDEQPCAYQIRFAGFKGVVAMDPYNAADADLQFRPSMQKFESPHRKLEILNVANYIPCFLNRQVIMILSGLGVLDEHFEVLHDEMLMQMAVMLLDAEESVHQLKQHYYSYPRIRLDGIGSVCVEPFFRSLLMAVYRKQLGDLLTRSRIFVANGRILMGTIDETGTLQEDEVFIQCRLQPEESCDEERTVMNGPDKFIVVSQVSVAKNPCMHPGDVRVLKAVNNPLLATCRWDVIVFPAKGPRPITDMCSGSDLDGDLYFVTWDSRLQAPSVDEPMSYEAAKEEQKENIGITDVRDFMVKFIKHDQLGSIANAHVAHVDLKPMGVRDKLCKELAMLFSLAVDFPKTGYLAQFPEEAQVENWPDFMNKGGEQPSYESRKVIGKMYRRAKLAFNNDLERISIPIKPHPQYHLKGRERYASIAESLYHSYTEEVARLLALYDISDEAQVLSACLNDLGGLGKEDVKDTMEIVGAQFKSIQKRYREMLQKQGEEDVKLMASAAYYACYGAPRMTMADRPILSFPWILGDILQSFGEGIASKDRGMEDVCDLLADQVNSWLQEAGNVSDKLAEYLERMRIVDVVRDLLQEDVEVIGSTPMFCFGEFSDINVVCAMPVDDVIERMKEFRVLDQSADRVVIEIGDYAVQVQVKVSSTAMGVDTMQGYLHRYWPLAEVIRKWAEAFRLVRHGPHHVGKMPTWKLVSLLFKFIKHTGMGEPREGSGDVDWKSFVTTLKCTRGHMLILLRFLQFMAFAPKAEMHIFAEPGLEAWLPVMREASVRSFHVLSQTLNVRQLWAMGFQVDDAEMAAALLARQRIRAPKLLTRNDRMRSTGGFFVQGCSRMLFERALGRRDRLRFEPFKGRVRTSHLDKHCFVPVPVLPDDSALQNTFCRTEFYSHFQRQLLTAFRLGSEEWGQLRLFIKLGKSYVMNLPRMFVEEAGSATIESLQEALDRCYRKADVDLKRIRKDATCALTAPRNDEKAEEEKEAEAAEPQVKENVVVNMKAPDNSSGGVSGEKSQRMIMGGSKKTSHLPMNSAFEPGLGDSQYAKVREFLDRFEFVKSNDVVEGRTFSLSLPMYDENDGSVSDYQIHYNQDASQIVKARTFPLRWMLCDVKGGYATSDIRVSLTSMKPLDLQSSKIPEDIVTLLPDDVRGVRHPMIGEGYRLDKQGTPRNIYARSNVGEAWTPSTRTFSLLSQAYPQYEPLDDLDSLFCRGLVLNLDHVTEWTELTREGVFTHVMEKLEMGARVQGLTWQMAGDVAAVDTLIRNTWSFANMLKKALSD